MGPIFFVAGIGIVVFLQVVDADVAGRVFGSVIGGIFAVVGLVATFYRDELKVDFIGKRYERRKGFTFALKEYSGGLEDFRRVLLKSEVRRSKNSTYIVYICSLLLRHEGDDERISLTQTSDEADARSRGEALAKAFSIPLRDETGETPLERAPGELDLSLRERAAKKGEALDFKKLADPPGRLKECLTVEGQVLTFVLPRGGARAAGCFLLVFGAMWNSFVVFALVMLVRSPDETPGALIGLAFLLPFLLVGVGVLVGAAWVLLSREKVTLSPEGVSSEKLFLSGSWLKRAARSDEVEEVSLRSGKKPGERPHVYVRTDTRIVRLGSSLKPGELEWLERITRAVLSA